MYERFFGLVDAPFRLTPDPRYLFLSRKHAEALAHLKLGLSESSGFVCITGDVGTGKTTLLRSFLTDVGPETSSAYIFNPALSALELLQTINAELGIPATSSSPKALVDALNAHLLAQREAGRRSIVVIDEAQGLSIDVLEQLRLLSNLETTTEKLLRIVLVGQPQLRTLLTHPELAQLNQRITLRWHMGPLAYPETVAYIRHRLAVASGGEQSTLFSRTAIWQVHRLSHGIPRLINMIAHRALVAAFAADERTVGARTVRRAYREIGALPLTVSAPRPRRRAVWAATGLAAGIAVVALGLPRLAALPTLHSAKREPVVAPHDAPPAPVVADHVGAPPAPPAPDADAAAAIDEPAPPAEPRPPVEPPAQVAAAPAPVDPPTAVPPPDAPPPAAADPAPPPPVAAAEDARPPEDVPVPPPTPLPPTAPVVGAVPAPPDTTPPVVAPAAVAAAPPAASAPGPAPVVAAPPADPAPAVPSPPAPVVAAVAPAVPAPSPPDTSAAVESRLVARDAPTTARAAVQALLAAWHARPLDAGESGAVADLTAIAARRGLEHLPLVGNGSMLRLLDLPAVLELRLPTSDGPRYATVTSVDGLRATLTVDGEPMSVDENFLDRYWFGQAYILWRDFEALGPTFGREGRGPAVARLQTLLARAGSYAGTVSGTFDASTAAAVVAFQRARFLVPDGRVGKLTRIVLYAAAGGYPRPMLGTPRNGAS